MRFCTAPEKGLIIEVCTLFYEKSIGFLKVSFYPKYYSFRRCYVLKAKMSKTAV